MPTSQCNHGNTERNYTPVSIENETDQNIRADLDWREHLIKSQHLQNESNDTFLSLLYKMKNIISGGNFHFSINFTFISTEDDKQTSKNFKIFFFFFFNPFNWHLAFCVPNKDSE